MVRPGGLAVVSKRLRYYAGVAADINEITDSNHGSPALGVEHVMLLEILALVRKHDDLLEQFRPLLERYSAHGMIGAAVADRRARKANRE
jgi:hypothetical protein